MKKILLLSAALLIPSHGEQPIPDLWWDTIEGRDNGNSGGGNSDTKDPEILAFLKLERFEEWVDYEDDLVKFRYPKHPLLKLTINNGGENEERVTVEGAVVTSVNNFFNRAYVLKAGETTYQVLLLNSEDWLDDGR